ncbi:MAG: MATE family efflux transporter [Lachnospirales bacterium]
MEKNLTTGSVFKTIVYFSLPYLLSYFLQTLYGMADLFIIGQFKGVDSTTAVSIGSQIMHMITVMIVGLAVGSTVIIGRLTGAGDKKQISTAIGNTVTLFIGISLILMAILLTMVNPIVDIMSTPEEAIAETIKYLKICFIGIPFITMYNVISSILRGMGDSKRPMYFISIACVANIVLDYIFIGRLNLGASGAALGTTISQAFSVIISLFVIKKGKDIKNLSLKIFKPRIHTIKELLKIGIPVSLQDGFIQISFIIITIIVNRRGLNDAAAVGIVEKIICILFLVPSSMMSTVSALVAQNIGANKHNRAKATLKYALLISVIFGTIVAISVQFVSEPLVNLFVQDKDVVILGGQYLRSYVWDCIFAGIHFSFSGYFYAYGLSIISFIHNSISIIGVRIPFSYLASKHFANTLFPMGLAAPAGSLLSAIICFGVFIWLNKRNNKNLKST